MAGKLGWVNYISIDGAEPVLFSSLSKEEHETVIKRMGERVSRVLSVYLSNHPEDLKAIFDKKEDT